MGAEELKVEKFRPYHEQKDRWKENDWHKNDLCKIKFHTPNRFDIG